MRLLMSKHSSFSYKVNANGANIVFLKAVILKFKVYKVRSNHVFIGGT